MAKETIGVAMSTTVSPATKSTEVKSVKVNENVTILVHPEKESRLPPGLASKWLTTRAAATYDKVALVTVVLGMAMGIGLSLTRSNPSMGLYIISIALFHFLEFWVTARYNPKALGMFSFLLLNGVEYAFANVFAASEYLISWYVQGKAPQLHGICLLSVCIALVAGQIIRSGAMIHAAQSFNHYVQQDRHDDHVLVKTGIYGYIRHPSYFGYYLWTVALQLLVRNWVSAALSSLVLCIYFSRRLDGEEAALIRFFGDEYRQYRRDVWSGIIFRR